MKVLFIIVLIAMIAIIIVNIIWDRALSEREKKYKDELKTFKREQEYRQVEIAHFRADVEVLKRDKEQFKERELNLAARKESVLELEATLRNKQTYLAGLESQLNDRADELAKKSAELEEASKAVLDAACLAVVPDIIEPVEVPVVMTASQVETKFCPRCGKPMERKTDVVYTSIPPQYKYICPECGYEEVDTCPPTHNLVGTDKKPVKKARRAKK